MSNRQNLRPPAEVRAAAAAYRCSDCGARVKAIRWNPAGQRWDWRIEHQPTCPRLRGDVGADRDAMNRVGQSWAEFLQGATRGTVHELELIDPDTGTDP